MQTGTYISGALHIGLIGWALFGGTFRSDPLPFEVTEVSVISSAEFAALMRPDTAPEAVIEPAALPQPEVTPDQPALDPGSDPDPERDVPDQPVPVVPEPAEAPDVPEPPPEAEVTDTAPEQPVPAEPELAAQPTPEAAPAPSERVAPEPVAPPPPDARPDDVAREEVTPDEGAETPQETQEATAPEEATTEIVTEADDVAALAPTRSVRPLARRPRPEPEPAAQPAPDTGAAVENALAEALSGADPAPAPTGPPLSAGEKDALRVSVSRCWNVGSLSSEALGTTVVVAVSMTQDGTPVTSSIEMLSSSGGGDTAARQAFEAARRAIIRCGASGFDLPAEKYGQWRDIEMTFNPERMRIK